MSGMLVIHTAGDHQGTHPVRQGKPPSGTAHHLLLPLQSNDLSQVCLWPATSHRDKTPRNPYFLPQAPQWTLSLRMVRG